MPTAETLERFIALVEQNAHIEAVEGFYTPRSSLLRSAPFTGALRPLKAQSSPLRSMVCVWASPLTFKYQPVNLIWVTSLGSNVIRWIFRFGWLDGSVTQMEELAYQRWEGERIAEETFFYDPAQLEPRKAHA